MKYLIVSDIHGSLPRLQKVISFFEQQKYDMLLILGDILNYGPRNGLPEGLDAMGIANLLNTLSNKIVAVRGNCDSEVDQMLLKFPIMSDVAILVNNGIRLLLTHGHKYNPESQPLSADVICTGHTHVWQLEKQDRQILLNTGSITFPKNGNIPTFATLDDDNYLRVRNLDGEIIKEQLL